MKRFHGYRGKVWEKEEWWTALKVHVQEGAASKLDPHYLSEELTSMAESVLLLLDAKEEAEEATS